MMKNIVLLLTVVFALQSIPAQDNQNLEQLYTRKAVKAFVAKDFTSSIEYIKQVIRINPNNKQAKKLMAKCYYFQSTALFKKGEYQLAQDMLTELFVIIPAHKQGEALKLKVDKKIAAMRPAQPASGYQQQPMQQVQQVQQMQPQQIIVKTDDGKRSEKMIAAFLEQSTQQRGLQQRTDSLNREQSSELMNLMKDRDVASETRFKSTFIWVVIIIIGTILVIIGVVFFLAKMFIKTSELQSAQQYEVLQNLLTQGPVMQQSALQLTATAGSTEKDLDADDDLARANAVEAVAEGLATSDSGAEENKGKIEKVRLLLGDSNNRVRANAAKVIYNIDKKASLEALSDMVFSSSKRQNASGIWALGEIHTTDALAMIYKKVDENDDDEIINHNLLNALKKVQSEADDDLDEDEKLELVQKIEKLQSIDDE